MTAEDFEKLPFRMVCSLAMEHEHCATYINDQYGFMMCVHTQKKADGFTFGRSYTHYKFLGKVYKTKAKFLEAIKDVNVITEFDVRKKFKSKK